jgi:hypothetical protein
VSTSGARIELSGELDLPENVVVSLSHDGTVRRRCARVWQLPSVVGLRFVA